MIIASVIAKLSEPGTPFSIIEGANELAEVKERPKATPAAYVYVVAEASGRNERIAGSIMQRSAIDIAVLIITENLAGKSDAARDIETLKTFVRSRLLGFVATPDAEPVEHVEGKIVSAKDRMVWFEDVFATATYLMEQP